MKTIQNDIKTKEFKPVYLICGNETYLKNNCKKQLKRAITNDDTMNYQYYEGKNPDVKEIIDSAETMPFFADYRLLLIENSGFFKSSNEELVTYIDDFPESTIFVFVEDEVDKRGKLFKKVKSKGYVCEITTPKEAELQKWIMTQIGKEHKNIRRETLQLFVHTVGDDMQTIVNELEKLLNYAAGHDVITDEDVLLVCTKRIEVKIFDLFTYMAAGNQKKTMEIYQDLVENKEPYMKILFMLARQFNQLLGVKDLLDKGISKKEIASKLSLRSDWVVSQLQRQADNYSKKRLIKALKECAENEEAVKTGRLDEKASVEMLLIKYSRKI